MFELAQASLGTCGRLLLHAVEQHGGPLGGRLIAGLSSRAVDRVRAALDRPTLTMDCLTEPPLTRYMGYW